MALVFPFAFMCGEILCHRLVERDDGRLFGFCGALGFAMFDRVYIAIEKFSRIGRFLAGFGKPIIFGECASPMRRSLPFSA